MKYDDMNPIVDSTGKFFYADNYHLLGDEGICSQCGSLTHAIDVFSEGYICSEECQSKFDEWCNCMINNMMKREGVIK